MSNSLKMTKASAWAMRVFGVSQSTSQNATISSRTRPPWSGTPSARPVRSHARQPMAKDTTSTARITVSERPCSNTTHNAQPSSVPQVPGAGRSRPLPNPNATIRQRLVKTQPTVGRTAAREPGTRESRISAKVIETAHAIGADRHRATDNPQAPRLINMPHPRNANAMLSGQGHQGVACRRRGGEAKLVDVAAIEHGVLHDIRSEQAKPRMNGQGIIL